MSLNERCMYMFLMRDEKEERKKQARSNKQEDVHSTCTCTYQTAIIQCTYYKYSILVYTSSDRYVFTTTVTQEIHVNER